MLKSLRRKSLGSSINKSQSSQRNSISYLSVPTKDRGKDRTWVGKIPLSRIRNTPQNTTIEKDFCLVDESPFRMIKVEYTISIGAMLSVLSGKCVDVRAMFRWHWLVCVNTAEVCPSRADMTWKYISFVNEGSRLLVQAWLKGHVKLTYFTLHTLTE